MTDQPNASQVQPAQSQAPQRSPDNITMFLDVLRARLEQGASEYGDASFDRSTPAIIGEILEEITDVAGWAFVAWVAMQRHMSRVTSAIADVDTDIEVYRHRQMDDVDAAKADAEIRRAERRAESAEAKLAAAEAERDNLAEVVKLWREGLNNLARLGNEPMFGNSIGNVMARKLLAAAPAAKDGAS